jgi:hypothetical protein
MVYAGLLSGVDWETGKRRKRKGQSGTVEALSEDKSVDGLSMVDLLRGRVRAFSESLVLGSQGFVEEVFQASRDFFGPKRKVGARRMPQSAAPLYVARRVRSERSETPG